MRSVTLALLLFVTGLVAGCEEGAQPPTDQSAGAPFHSQFSRTPYVESGAYRTLKGR